MERIRLEPLGMNHGMEPAHKVLTAPLLPSSVRYICDELENAIWEAGFNVAAIHGDKQQQDREWAIGEIRAGRMPLLVATDVAARGLDIKV
jgi:ATP-dependent RNA helicase DDX5/DBP2